MYGEHCTSCGRRLSLLIVQSVGTFCLACGALHERALAVGAAVAGLVPGRRVIVNLPQAPEHHQRGVIERVEGVRYYVALDAPGLDEPLCLFSDELIADAGRS